MTEWNDFYVATEGASAMLAGLIFVRYWIIAAIIFSIIKAVLDAGCCWLK